jgi:hypothetical protein
MIFHGEKEEIKDLHSKIEEWTSKEFRKSDFGSIWLGNILHGAGLGHNIDAGDDRFRCRGSITYFGELETFKDSDEATFNLDTETAWAPMCSMWREVIDTLDYKTVGFSYCAEEPGFDIYEIYDPYGDFGMEYRVDMYVGGQDFENKELMRIYDMQEYCDDDSLKTALQELLKTDDSNLESLIEAAENYKFESDDSFLYVRKYTHVDVIEY